MSENRRAVVAGHICLDVLPDLSASSTAEFLNSFQPGRLIQVGPVLLSTGGPVSNTGLALHKLGIKTQLMGKIGDDLFGQAVRQIVASFDTGLAQGMVVDSTADTSYTIVISPPGIDRYFLHCPGANDTFTADDVRYDMLADADLFHFGYPPLMKMMYVDNGTQLTETFRRARATGVTTSLDLVFPDPSSPAGQTDWVTIMEATLPHVEVFLPSVEEILFMIRRDTYDRLTRAAGGSSFLDLIGHDLLSDLAQQLIDWGVKIVGLKMGERGFYIKTANLDAIKSMGRTRPSNPETWADQELWAPCFKVEVVGTSGAGDATIAGFLSALLRDMSPAEALTAAVAVGACNVEAADTLSGLRAWEETMVRISQGWERHPLDMPAPGWYYHEEHNLWWK
jgi:sugar/nucleoside kinase (ribokinase family)